MKSHICLALLLSVCFVATQAPAAPADGKEYAVVIRDMPLKCLPGRVYYQIGQLSQGDVVQVLEERFDWARVRSDLRPLEGYLPAATTSPGRDEDTVVTNSRVNILAPDRGGFSTSLFVLTVAEPGTILEVVERFREGGQSYLRVIAPRSAGGWLPLTALGPASEAQLQAYLAKVAELRGEPAEVVPLDDPEPGVEQPPVELPDAPIEEPAPPREEPIESKPQPEEPATTVEVELTPIEVQAEEAGVLSPRQLAELAERLLAEEIRTAEFDPAIHEFQRAEEALTLSETQQRALTYRRQTLELRRSVQEALLRAEGALAEAEKEAEALAKRVEQLRGKGTYNMTGRLLLSTVYTGEGLPKLYRLQSLATLSTRTSAYVDPGEIDGIQRYINSVIGVSGPIRFDESLGIYIIIAEHISILEN